MQFNQKLIKQLAAGEIAITTTPETMHLTREILKSAFPKDAYLDQGNIKSNWTYRAACHDNTFCVDGNPDGLKEVLAKDFILPEPRFKKGDWVRLSSGLKKEYQVLSFEYNDDYQLYFYKLSGCKLMEAEVELIPGNINESPTKCGSEKQFEIGKCYEFSDDNEEWSKGKLLAVVDHRDKYVVGFEDVVLGFEFIRPVQPKEVTKEDLVGLLNDWLELWDNDLLVTIDKSYNSTLDNLGMNTGSILHQLKNNLITQK